MKKQTGYILKDAIIYLGIEDSKKTCGYSGVLWALVPVNESQALISLQYLIQQRQ